MTGLILNLRPWESFLVGDHVLQNGGRKTQLRVRDERAGVLRLSDALHPDEVNSPLTRAYYSAQLLLLGRCDDGITDDALTDFLDQAAAALGSPRAIEEALGYAKKKRYFMVLRTLKPLLPEEVLLLSSRRLSHDSNPGAN